MEHLEYEIKLDYPRSSLSVGDNFKSFLFNPAFKKNLDVCDSVMFYIYGTPIGDSLLFLSTFQACIEYLNITRKNHLPTFYVDNKFESLLKHLGIFKNAVFIPDGVKHFKSETDKKKNIVMICDDKLDVSQDKSKVYNTEYSMFHNAPFVLSDAVDPQISEYNGDKKIHAFISRPAKLFLCFEMSVGTILSSDPDLALPDFIIPFDRKFEDMASDKFKIKFSKDKIVTIVSLASGVEKKFGFLKYIKLAKKLVDTDKSLSVFILASKKEESPSEWLSVKRNLTDYENHIKLINAENLELLAYILARSSVIIGNDTGFSHLGAMSKAGLNEPAPKTYIIYSNHDYGKWSAGKSNVFPITTIVSRFLRKNQMDGLATSDDPNFGYSQWAYSVKISRVFDIIKKSLDLGKIIIPRKADYNVELEFISKVLDKKSKLTKQNEITRVSSPKVAVPKLKTI